MRTILYYKGVYLSTHFLITNNGVNYVLDFIMDLEKSRPRESVRIQNRIQRMCQTQRLSPEHFSPEGNKIFAIKAYQTRIYGFYEGTKFIMVLAAIKKRDKADKNILKQVTAVREAYFKERKR